MKNATIKRTPGRPRGAKASEPSDLVSRVRAASGKSQVEFSVELGCSASAVSKFEQEERTPGTAAVKSKLFALAKKYGVKP